MIENRILGLRQVNWQNLRDLQPENLKEPFNLQHLKNSLQRNGFAMPFFGWEDNGDVFIIDGHTRHTVLNELIADGVDVPDTLPVVLLHCEDRKDAIKTLLEVYNSKKNPLDSVVLEEWVELEDIPVEDIVLESLDVHTAADAEDAGQGDAAGDESGVIKLTYTNEDYNLVRAELSKHGQNPEDAVYNLLGLK